MAPQIGGRAKYMSIIHLRSKDKPSGSTQKPPLSQGSISRYLGSVPDSVNNYLNLNKTSSANHSALYADNDFHKKSRLLTDMHNHPVKHHSFTVVIVVSSIFTLLTILIAIAIVVFCRKKNSVFALQKSEQEDDGEFELDDMNTDVEYTETDFESEYDNISRRKSFPPDTCDRESSHLLQGIPKMLQDPNINNQDSHNQDFHINYHTPCQCKHTHDKYGRYKQIVVSAVMENSQPVCHNGSDDCEVTIKQNRKRTKKNKAQQYELCDEDADSENDDYHDYQNMNNNCCKKSGGQKYSFLHDTGHVPDENRPDSPYDNVQYDSDTRCDSKDADGCRADYKGLYHGMDRHEQYDPKCYSDALYVQLPDEKDICFKEKEAYYVSLPPEEGEEKCDWSMKDSNYVDIHSDQDTLEYEDILYNEACCKQADDLGSEAEYGTHNKYAQLHIPLRSYSVTEKLCNLSEGNAQSKEPKSCPQTPLTDDHLTSCYGKMADGVLHRMRNGIYPHTVNHVEGINHTESSVSHLGSSNVSIDGTTGVSFVLSNPYSSLVSLAKDQYPNYMRPMYEETDTGGQNSHLTTNSLNTHPFPWVTFSEEESECEARQITSSINSAEFSDPISSPTDIITQRNSHVQLFSNQSEGVTQPLKQGSPDEKGESGINRSQEDTADNSKGEQNADKL